MMNKFKAKQIYLLTIIVSGIIALSVYSTYSIFTLESETSNILSINTPNTLSIYTNISEYKQVSISKNSYITTDIDIYNNFNYDLCYSIWYTVVGNSNIDTNKVKVYQNTSSSLTTSSTISSINSKRISLLVTNDNENAAKVNIGIAYSKNEGTCELNIDRNKSLIKDTIDNPKNLSKELTKNTIQVDNQAGYLTYKDIEKEVKLDDNIYVSKSFTYKDEIFTLDKPEKISSSEVNKYVSTETDNYYTCLSLETCTYLYRITEVKEQKESENISYNLLKYDYLTGYLEGPSGIRKVDDNYYYYGDNPSNFLYYNCSNASDIKTCELWRIIGFIHDETSNTYYTKIISDDFLTAHEYSDTYNIWTDSSIDKYLKEYKINNDNLIKEVTFKIENILSLDSNITYLNNDNKAKVMLMNLSDFQNTSICENKKLSEYDTNCLNNNWLNKNKNEWTMTVKYEEPYMDEETNETMTPKNNTVYSVGNNILSSLVTDKLSIRPVVYLSPRTIFTEGNGKFDNPYIIK